MDMEERRILQEENVGLLQEMARLREEFTSLHQENDWFTTQLSHIRSSAIHKDEEEVVIWLAEHDPKQKRLMYLRMRNLGNYLHNSEVLRKGYGEFRVSKFHKSSAPNSDYVEVRPEDYTDSIMDVVKGDELILKFGESCFRSEKDARSRINVSTVLQKVRMLAMLVTELQNLSGKKDCSLEGFLESDWLDVVAEAKRDKAEMGRSPLLGLTMNVMERTVQEVNVMERTIQEVNVMERTVQEVNVMERTIQEVNVMERTIQEVNVMERTIQEVNVMERTIQEVNVMERTIQEVNVMERTVQEVNVMERTIQEVNVMERTIQEVNVME
nr:hypothetical protein BaRGS_015229 [Batillaria attramentaria]